MFLLRSSPADSAAKLLGILAVVILCGAADAPPPTDIGGTGHIEPRGGVVTLGGPAATIMSINVRVGQAVKRGDVLVVLDDTQPKADLRAAELALEAAKRDSALAVLSEEAALKQASDHYRQAKLTADGYRSLGPDATSLTQRMNYDAQAREAATSLAIERRKDAQARASAAASLESAQSRFKLAQIALSKYHIAAPSDGIILQVYQHVGETLTGPAVTMGDISQMFVTCQIFQGDLLKIRPGLKATITSNALSKTLTGTVVTVSRLITTTTQTGDVRIKLNETDLASRLVGLEVEVKILL